jgi:hypothetical protein
LIVYFEEDSRHLLGSSLFELVRESLSDDLEEQEQSREELQRKERF